VITSSLAISTAAIATFMVSNEKSTARIDSTVVPGFEIVPADPRGALRRRFDRRAAGRCDPQIPRLP
jgi:hypothetical protein